MTTEPAEPSGVVTEVARPPRPEGLGPDGAWLWDEVTARFRLRPDEVRLLRDACMTADDIGELEKEIRFDREAQGSLKTEGSQGQDVAHPLVAEVRQFRSTLASLLKQLKLPDAPGSARLVEASARRSEGGRKAARARWS